MTISLLALLDMAQANIPLGQRELNVFTGALVLARRVAEEHRLTVPWDC